MDVYLFIIQGLYYIVTGIWPLVSIDTFMHATGPKADIWLVKTVGVLVTVIGAALINMGLNKDFSQGAFIIALGSAFGLTLIDIIYVRKKIISKIYLLDAAFEFIVIWAYLIL